MPEETWVRVDFLAMKEVQVVGKRVWRMEVAFLRAVVVRVFMVATMMEADDIDRLYKGQKVLIGWFKRDVWSRKSQEEARRQTASREVQLSRISSH